MSFRQLRTLLCGIGLLFTSLPVFAQSDAARAATAFDKVLQSAWKQEGIAPSPKVDDARFLRRIYLDIAGTLPPVNVVTEFLADTNPNKRELAIDALLENPTYVSHWTEYWNGVLMGKPKRTAFVDPGMFRDWVKDNLKRNTKYNRFVYDLLTATGVNGPGRTFAEAYGFGNPNMMMRTGTASTEANFSGSTNGAVNWYLNHLESPADLGGNAARLFLGIQLQCAECHDHKTEKWTQKDFRSFTASFIQTAARPPSGMRPVMGNVAVLNVQDVNFANVGFRPNAGEARRPYLDAEPTTLDGQPLKGNRSDRRKELATWITAEDNPYFAQATVNRLWGKLLGRGFVDPVDDFRPSNPTTLPAGLKFLADDFKAHEYDLKHLIKLITLTQAYQLTPATAPKQDLDNKLWSRFRVTSLEPERLVNALVVATNFQPVLSRLPGGSVEEIKQRLTRTVTFVFDTDEEGIEEKEFAGTIPQALLLLNGSLTNSGATPIPGTALAEVMAMGGNDEEKIESLYLRALSRKPTPSEVTRWKEFVNTQREVVRTQPNLPQFAPPRPGAGGAPARGGFDPLSRVASRPNGAAPASPKMQAYEDMFWALLNSSEFVFNH